jgi:hypothetical protein
MLTCTNCGHECPELAPGEHFCTDCGCPAANHHSKSAPPPKPGPEPLESPTPSGTYDAEISRAQRGCLLFLVDHSGSMEEPIASDFGSGQKKKDAVADAINRILQLLITRCTRGVEVWNYFDIGLWTYGGNNEVRTVFNLVPISQVAGSPKRVEDRVQVVPDRTGGTYEQKIKFPVWLEPMAQGQTPMKPAFEACGAALRNWIPLHRTSFPPVIIHLTDGSFTGEDPAQTVREVMALSTTDGNVMIFNCHISKDKRPELLFPGGSTAAGLQGLQRFLYDISSVLPDPMRTTAKDEGYNIEAGARGYVYNSKDTTMIRFLNIGTRAVQDKME